MPWKYLRNLEASKRRETRQSWGMAEGTGLPSNLLWGKPLK